jgi:hypothetical protein
MADDDTLFTFTHPGLLAFTGSILVPKAPTVNGKPQGNPRHEINILLDPDHPDLPEIKRIIKALAAGKHNPALGAFHLPLKRGTKMADDRNAKLEKMDPPRTGDREYLRDKIVLIARSKFPPLLSRIVGGEIVELHDAARQANASAFYPGAEALVQVRFAWYDPTPLTPAGGVNAFINQVLVTGKGKRFPGTGKSAEDTFKGYAGHASNEDPLAERELDDDIPF